MFGVLGQFYRPALRSFNPPSPLEPFRVVPYAPFCRKEVVNGANPLRTVRV